MSWLSGTILDAQARLVTIVVLLASCGIGCGKTELDPSQAPEPTPGDRNVGKIARNDVQSGTIDEDASHSIEPASTPAGLASTIRKGIELLKKKQYEEFLSTIVSPEMLRDIVTERSLADFADGELAGKRAETILTVLTGIQSRPPDILVEQNEAVFTLDEDSQSHITFVRIGDTWYLENIL